MKKNKKLKVATVFSGIGAPEQALKKLGIDNEIVFACDNGERELKTSREEIEKKLEGLSNQEKNCYIKKIYSETNKHNYVKDSYFANYNINEENWFEDVRFIDGANYKDKVDLFVGGSPCQSFSISGKRRGLEDTRGTLFFEFARLIKEIKPKVFIYENVPGMLSHDGGMTWNTIQSVFNELGYDWKLFKLNSKNYNIPQNRTRIYVVGFNKTTEIEPNFEIEKKELTTTVKDFLETKVDDKYYHGEKGFKWITKPLSLKKRVSINGDIARTQAANQQFNWCGDMIFYPIKDLKQIPNNAYIGEFNGEKGIARKLTPRECLRLMGFSDSFKIVVDDQKMYRQSGNSIVVNVLEEIIKEIIKTDVFE